MALQTGHSRGYFDDENDVEIVPMPPEGIQRIVTLLRVLNNDSASITPSLNVYTKKFTKWEFEYVPITTDKTLATKEEFEGSSLLDVLEHGNTVTGSLAAAVTTEQPSFIAAWLDEPVGDTGE